MDLLGGVNNSSRFGEWGLAGVSAWGRLCFGVVDVVLVNFAVARAYGICRPLFDMLSSAFGVGNPNYCVSEWRYKRKAEGLRCSEH